MGSVMREITSPTNRLVYKINENDQISTIIIAINKTNDLKNINIDKGTIVCSVEELEDEKQLLSFISKFFQIIRMTYKINPNPQFNIIVNTKEEEVKLKNIAELLNQNNIKCYIIETEEYKQQKQLQSNQIEQIKEEQKEVLATGSKEIVKQGQNGENTSREFTIVEQNNNGHNIDNNSQLLNDGIDTRDVLNNIYYIDEYTNEIYEFDKKLSKSKLIGKLGPIYYRDINNHLVKNNEVIGAIENIKDMPQAKITEKKRVLEKPNCYISFLLFSIIISLALIVYIVIKLT